MTMTVLRRINDGVYLKTKVAIMILVILPLMLIMST